MNSKTKKISNLRISLYTLSFITVLKLVIYQISITYYSTTAQIVSHPFKPSIFSIVDKIDPMVYLFTITILTILYFYIISYKMARIRLVLISSVIISLLTFFIPSTTNIAYFLSRVFNYSVDAGFGNPFELFALPINLVILFVIYFIGTKKLLK